MPATKSAVSIQKRAYYLAHKEAILAKRREYYSANTSKVLERIRVYRLDNLELVKSQEKSNRLRHPERVKANLVAFHEANPSYAIEHNKAYYAANREKILEANRLWAINNSEVANAYYRKYKRSNPEKVCEWAGRRRARIAGVASTPVDYAAIRARNGMVCSICALPITEKFHYDHIIPLAPPGNGSHTTENIQLAHPSCNMAKGAKLNYKSKGAR